MVILAGRRVATLCLDTTLTFREPKQASLRDASPNYHAPFRGINPTATRDHRYAMHLAERAMLVAVGIPSHGTRIVVDRSDALPSIPQVTFIILNTVFVEKGAVFLLERLYPVMFALVLDVSLDVRQV